MNVQRPDSAADYAYLDAPDIRGRFVDYADETLTRVTFRIEGIHCVACVWLLENLPRLNPGIQSARVNFPTRELAVQFSTEELKLSDLVLLLASVGYTPELKLEQLEDARPRNINRRLWLQLGVAGFAFGNTMLFSVARYLGLDKSEGTLLAEVIGWLSLALAVPVVVFSAGDYWRSAWTGIRQGRLSIEVPIAIGLLALLGQSAYEVVTRSGEGYFDSLAGLVFFLLIGRVFQRKTYDRLSFDRDYKSFFPLAASRRNDHSEERVALSEIKPGDKLIIRNGELIPADGDIVSGPGLIDYSFVTGESKPVVRTPGEQVHAGGRQMGAAIEVETMKSVSQGYLTSLWNQDAFQRERADDFQSVTNRFSPWFTVVVLAIALGAAAYWLATEPARSLTAFTAVLIVACPCALALSAPFALGTAQRILGAAAIYLKNPGILERLAKVDTVVFDKTGTLTHESIGEIEYVGATLGDVEKHHVRSMAEQSAHPYAARIARTFSDRHSIELVEQFQEFTGRGMTARVGANEIRLGSANWLRELGNPVPDHIEDAPVHLVIDGRYRGAFVIHNTVREQIHELVDRLRTRLDLALLSGDNAREEQTFRQIFGSDTRLKFNQGPEEKLEFIRALQQAGRTVMMVGDGLNDAGALRQSDVGVAVVENTNRFSPASDIILTADRIGQLADLLRYAKSAVNVVRLCLAVSILYNLVGLTFAAQGMLSPVVCAILMPTSSITVVALASGLAAWLGRHWSSPTFSREQHQPEDTLKRELQLQGGVA